jgi:hypothetical protein
MMIVNLDIFMLGLSQIESLLFVFLVGDRLQKILESCNLHGDI